MDREAAAARLGAPVREIVSVTPLDVGVYVVTHDGTPTLITEDGLLFGDEARAVAYPQPEDQPPAEDEAAEDEPAGGTGTEDASFVLMPAGSGVPSGNAADVMAWVNEAPAERAPVALAQEQAREKPRTTLVAALEKLTSA